MRREVGVDGDEDEMSGMSDEGEEAVYF
jgi:hypothetical protein